MSKTAAEYTMSWGNTAGEPIEGQLSIDSNKLYYDGNWKTIEQPAHNHHIQQSANAFYTYNDSDLKINKIVDVITELLMAIEPVIDIPSMKKIAKKLTGLREAANQWTVFPETNPWTVFPNPEIKRKPKEEIKLEEDLFEI
jgi:hypothetical protein